MATGMFLAVLINLTEKQLLKINLLNFGLYRAVNSLENI